MTFTIKLRGAPAARISRDFTCEHHGPFGELVPQGTESTPCPTCGTDSPRTVSAPPVHTQFVVTASKGPSAPKPHRDAMDLRPLAEGQRLSEWRKERAKVHEAARHKRIKEAMS